LYPSKTRLIADVVLGDGELSVMTPEMFNVVLIGGLTLITAGGLIVVQANTKQDARKLFEGAPLDELWELTNLPSDEQAQCTLLSLCSGSLFGNKCYVKQDGKDSGYFENSSNAGEAEFHCQFYEGGFWRNLVTHKRDSGDWTYAIHMRSGEKLKMDYWGINFLYRIEADDQFYEFRVDGNQNYIQEKGKRAGAFCKKPGCVIAIDRAVPNQIKALICSVVWAHAMM
jgi:hypothetical protein